MGAEFRRHPGQRGDLLVTLDQPVGIDFQEQAPRQRLAFGQQQRQLPEILLAAQRGQGDAQGQLAVVGGQPVQPQAHGLQVAVGHQVEPHRGRNEQSGGNRRLVGGGAQHQHRLGTDGSAGGVAQRLGGQLEAVVFQRRQDRVLPGALAGFGGRLRVGGARDHDLVVAGALGPHQAEVQS